MAELTTRDQEVRLLIPGTTFPVESGKKGKLHLYCLACFKDAMPTLRGDFW